MQASDSQLLFNNNNSFSVVYNLASIIFQICVLLELTYRLTRHIVCLVKVIPLAQRVQVPAHLVRLEQWQLKKKLNVVITTSFKISTTYFKLLIDNKDVTYDIIITI